MSGNNVDNRVVEMQFNNKQFEENIQTSTKSLNNLKKGLNLDESAKSLSNLDRVGRSFSLAGIAEGVDKLVNKFSTLGIIGITALQNITNSAINAGKQLISSLTIDPIKTGLDEYETKMNAITTILTNTKSKGTTLDDVNKALADLNDYSDKTIYNFAEMTRNIGTFTAAGVDLKTSTESIKGIANLAAGSGSSALQASSAMYQLSQAIASGSVKLMDWNSVVNAGMGGELFQKALEKTALELGKGRDMSVAFRDSLQDGWITTEVLTKTLSKFANDESLVKAATQVTTFTKLIETMKESVQSGWAQTWENIIGNKEESATFFTNLNNGFSSLVGSSTDARNAMWAFWKANGGREAAIQALSNAFNGLQSILKPIGDAFKEIFPAMTGQRLIEITQGIKDLTANFKIGEETADKIKRTFAGLFALLDIGKQALFAVGHGLAEVLKYLMPAGDGFLSVTANIGDFLVSIDKAIKSSNAFNVAIEKVGNFLKPIADGVKNSILLIIAAFQALGDADMTGLDSFSERVRVRFEPFTKLGEFVSGIFSKIAGVIQKVAPVFFKLATIIGNAFDKMRQNIVKSLDNAEFNSIFDMVNGGLFAMILYGLKKFIDSLTDITKSAGGFADSFKGILDGVKGSLEAYQSSLKANTLLKIAIAIGILAAALVTLSLIDSDKLTSSLGAMTVMFTELFTSMAAFEKIMKGPGFAAMGKISVMMIGLSTAILLLSHAMQNLAVLDWNGIAKGLTAIAALSGILIGSAKLLENNTASLVRASIGFILFGTAINILASAVQKLSGIDAAGLAGGLIAVGVLCAELALFMKVTDLDGMGLLKGAGLLLLATAVDVLASAVKKLSELDAGAMTKGLAGIAAILAELAIFVNVTGDVKRVMTTAIGLTILGAAMLIFAQAIGSMGSLSFEEIGKGLMTMAASLAIVTAALNFMPSNMVLTGVGLIAVATALVILAKALQSMGGMSWEEIAKGLITMAASLTIIAVAMMFMTGALAGAAALLIISAGLAVLAVVLKTLGSMSLAEIGKAILALVAVFVVLGAAAYVLAPLTPVILALGVAIALLGVGCLAVGAGLLLFSAGLAALSVSGAAGAVALVAIVTAMAGLIPMVLTQVAKGIVDFVKTLGDNVQVIVDVVVKIVIAVVDALVILIPKVVEAIYKILTAILETLVQYLPRMVDAGMKIIIAFLKGIADNIGEVVKTAIEVVLNYIKAIASMIPKVIDAGFQMMIEFINGLAESIRKNTPLLIDAVNNLFAAVIEAGILILASSLTRWMDVGKKIMDSGVIQGVMDKISGFVSAIKELITKGVDAITDKIGDFTEVGKNIINGLIGGVKAMASSVVDSVKGVVGGAIDGAKKLLGIHSPSRVFAEMGMYMDKGMANGLTKFSGLVGSASEDVGNTAIESLSNAISNISDVVNGNIDTSPVIRPVLDLSNVEAGGQKINKLFGQNRSINLSSISGKLPNVGQTNKTETSTPTKEPTPSRSTSIKYEFHSPKALDEATISRTVRRESQQLQLLLASEG